MMQRSESGRSALRFGQGADRAPRSRAAIRMHESSVLPRTSKGRRRLSAVDVTACPVHPADAAQAGLFERILQAEIAELRQLATLLVPRWTDSGTDDHRLLNTFTELTARIEEVDRMLEALRDRFPQGSLLSEPSY